MRLFGRGPHEPTPIVAEIRERAINIERKIDALNNGGVPASLPGQRYGHLSYSQHGEDMVLVSLFEQLGISTPSYLDIGAHHPLVCSNTALLYSRGARGINVDANPAVIEDFKKLRPDDINISIAVGAKPGQSTLYRPDERSGLTTLSPIVWEAIKANAPDGELASPIEVEVITINDLVSRYAAGRFLDLLSVDIEGLDLEVLENADFSQSRPKIICVEYINSAQRDPEPFIDLMSKRGFQFAIRMFANLIFLSEDAARYIRPTPTTLSPV